MTATKNVKIGQIETVKELGSNLTGQIIGQKIKNKEGKVIDNVAFRKFDFETPDRLSSGINILVKTSSGMVEATLFGECVDAFEDRVFFDPESFSWKEFIPPVIGDFVKLTGTHTRKWKKLTKSSNPALKKGFWAPGFRVLSPTDILIRKRPDKPSLEDVRTRQAAAKRHGAI